MEYYDHAIKANFAYANKGKWQAIWDGASTPIDGFNDPEWSSKFHTWVLEWDEQTMRILLDGTFLNSINLHTTINKTDGRNPFRQPHYLLLNLALGGNRGGNLDKTVLPSENRIDYVRIYQRKS